MTSQTQSFLSTDQLIGIYGTYQNRVNTLGYYTINKSCRVDTERSSNDDSGSGNSGGSQGTDATEEDLTTQDGIYYVPESVEVISQAEWIGLIVAAAACIAVNCFCACVCMCSFQPRKSD